jgi:hypothetical protein
MSKKSEMVTFLFNANIFNYYIKNYNVTYVYGMNNNILKIKVLHRIKTHKTMKKKEIKLHIFAN